MQIFTTTCKSGVTVGLQNPSYEGTEGSTLSVCVELLGIIQRSVTVSMVITDGSANGRYTGLCEQYYRHLIIMYIQVVKTLVRQQFPTLYSKMSRSYVLA